MWKQVYLLVLHDLVGQGELGLRGDWGPLKFTPQQSKSQVCQDLLSNTDFNYIFDTRKVVFMVEEEVIGKKENAKPLTLGN